MPAVCGRRDEAQLHAIIDVIALERDSLLFVDDRVPIRSDSVEVDDWVHGSAMLRVAQRHTGRVDELIRVRLSPLLESGLPRESAIT